MITQIGNFLVKYILCIGVLPYGDKICDNKNNSI